MYLKYDLAMKSIRGTLSKSDDIIIIIIITQRAGVTEIIIILYIYLYTPYDGFIVI